MRMEDQIPARGTDWQRRVGWLLRVLFGGFLLLAGLSGVGWEIAHDHAHTGHQIIFSGLILIGLWVIFEDRLLQALETMANIIQVLLPWGGKKGSGD